MAPPPRLRVLRDALPLWWRVARQWFTGASSRRSARSYAALCTALAAATTMLSVRISYAQRRFSTALAERNADAWHAAVLEYVCIILVAAPLRAVDVYVEKRLIALWRASLTGALIQAYCSGRVYFHMQLARGTEGIHPSSDDAADSSADAAAHDASVDDADRLEAAAVPRGASCTLEMAPLHGARVTHAAAAAAAGHSTASTSAAAAEGQLPGGGGAAAALAAGDAAAALVDNPDQRITADVANFVSTSVSLVLLLIKKLLNCAAFAGVLWSISPRLVIFLLLYALVGTVGTAALFGRPLTRLQQRILRLEADLRFGLVRLRENAEAVAFYCGGAREEAGLHAALAAVLVALLGRIRWLGVYELWVTAYSYATVLVPSLALAPAYMAGQVEFGVITQASYAFRVLEDALGIMLARLDDFSSLAAETSRLTGLLDALRAADVDGGGAGSMLGFEPMPGATATPAPAAARRSRFKRLKSGPGDGSDNDDGGENAHNSSSIISSSDRRTMLDCESAPLLKGSSSKGAARTTAVAATTDNAFLLQRPSRVLRLVMEGEQAGGLAVEGLTAWVPGRHHVPMCVCANLGFQLAPGESILVVGPSGCGKSSLLRVLAGLWGGSGTVRSPPDNTQFFLPQKPYTFAGTLRDQLLFGPPSSSGSSADDSSSDYSTDSLLVELLHSLSLGHLLSRFPGGLDARLDWGSVLSLGEQQRIALARLLHRRPQLAFLDEATSALDEASEEQAYRLLRGACATFVSVGHRASLLRHHTHVLTHKGAGCWVVLPAADFAAQVPASRLLGT